MVCTHDVMVALLCPLLFKPDWLWATAWLPGHVACVGNTIIIDTSSYSTILITPTQVHLFPSLLSHTNLKMITTAGVLWCKFFTIDNCFLC